MPEGDTLPRTAAGLRPYLVGRPVTAARATGGPQVGRARRGDGRVGRCAGKNLLIRLRQRPRGADAPADDRHVASLPARRALAPAGVSGASSSSRCRARSPSASMRRSSSCSRSRAEAIHPTLARLGPDLLRRGRSTRPRPCVGCATRRGPSVADRRGAARPAGAGRDRQRLAERDPLHRAGRSVRARSPRWTTRCSARLVATARGSCSPMRTGGAARNGSTTGGDRGGRRCAAVGLRPGRAALPPLRDGDPVGDARARAASDPVVVPVACSGVRSPRRLAAAGRIIGTVCEHYVARSDEPFRIDELWPFTERLERFGMAGFGWGAAWRTADGRLETYRDVRAFRDDPERERIGATETTSLLVHLRRPSKLSTLGLADTQPFADPAGRFVFSHNGDCRQDKPRARRYPGPGPDPRPGGHRGRPALARGRLDRRASRRPPPRRDSTTRSGARPTSRVLDRRRSVAPLRGQPGEPGLHLPARRIGIAVDRHLLARSIALPATSPPRRPTGGSSGRGTTVGLA